MRLKEKSNEDDVKSKFGVQSVEIGLHVLEVLAQAYRPMGLRELAALLEMPPAKVHRYLVSLIRAGMVEQSGAGGRYGLGPMAVTLGLSALKQLDIMRISETAIAELRDRIDHIVLLAIWGDVGPTVIRWEDSHRPVAVNVRIGSILQTLDSATGLIFAAYLPRHVTATRIAEEIGARTPEEVEKLLAEVRDRGMSRVRGHQLASINALSVPVFDHTGKVVAAITALGPERTINVDWNGNIAKELRIVAQQISLRLGWAAPKTSNK
ncbi:MAG: IclR family transcriptional regulator [Xanthobacteraceae bacterium]|nr:MAG: IclR family transcriptional regulator [Xanthobacteraceae bacterium]